MNNSLRKQHRITFRCTQYEYEFLQWLKYKGMGISSYLTTTLRMSDLYKEYARMMDRKI